MSKSLFKDSEIGEPNVANGIDFDPDVNDIDKQKARRYGADTTHRKRLVIWVMIIIPVWLVAVLFITALCSPDAVSDTVKTTLLVTTTANVIGLALVVLKGIFPNNEQ